MGRRSSGIKPLATRAAKDTTVERSPSLLANSVTIRNTSEIISDCSPMWMSLFSRRLRFPPASPGALEVYHGIQEKARGRARCGYSPGLLLFEDNPFTVLACTFSIDDLLLSQTFRCSCNCCFGESQQVNHFYNGNCRIHSNSV